MWTVESYLEDKGITVTSEDIEKLEMNAEDLSKALGYKRGIHADENGFYSLFKTEVLDQLMNCTLTSKESANDNR